MIPDNVLRYASNLIWMIIVVLVAIGAIILFCIFRVINR